MNADQSIINKILDDIKWFLPQGSIRCLPEPRCHVARHANQNWTSFWYRKLPSYWNVHNLNLQLGRYSNKMEIVQKIKFLFISSTFRVTKQNLNTRQRHLFIIWNISNLLYINGVIQKSQKIQKNIKYIDIGWLLWQVRYICGVRYPHGN